MPVVPIETPSETEIVLNSIGVPPAARIPSLTCLASTRWLRLHGIVSIQVVATPTSGLARSSSVKPTAFSIARAGARSTPSVRARAAALGGIGRLRVDAHGTLRLAGGAGGCRGESSSPLASAPCVGDAERKDPGVRQARLELGGDRLRLRPSRPRRRPTARSRRESRRPSRRPGASAARRAAARRASRNGSCRRSWNASARSAASPEAIAAPSRADWAAAATASSWRRNSGSRDARLLRVHARVRDDDDRRQRQVGCEPPERGPLAAPPDQADAAAKRGGEIVGMALERQPELEQLVGRGVAAGGGDARDEPRRDGRGGRAEPALERDPVDEAEAVALDRRDEREGAEREVLGRREAARRRPRPRARPAARRSRPARRASSFQRSSAAAAQSNPGPRLAVEAGARTTTTVTAHEPTSARIASTARLDDGRGRRGQRRRPPRCPSARAR